MEEVMDFDQWILEHKIEITYWAVYDPETGKVNGIYPNESADEFKYKIKIDPEMGEAIGAGKISLTNCYIDLESDSLEIAEVKSLLKIDDVLHRIPDSCYQNIENPELIIKFNKDCLRFELSDKAKGKKRIHYSGDTIMNFYITEYNDPNLLVEKVTIQIDDLVRDAKIYNLILPAKFSIYTRRIFKNYLLINENN